MRKNTTSDVIGGALGQLTKIAKTQEPKGFPVKIQYAGKTRTVTFDQKPTAQDLQDARLHYLEQDAPMAFKRYKRAEAEMAAARKKGDIPAMRVAAEARQKALTGSISVDERTGPTQEQEATAAGLRAVGGALTQGGLVPTADKRRLAARVRQEVKKATEAAKPIAKRLQPVIGVVPSDVAVDIAGSVVNQGADVISPEDKIARYAKVGAGYGSPEEVAELALDLAGAILPGAKGASRVIESGLARNIESGIARSAMGIGRAPIGVADTPLVIRPSIRAKAAGIKIEAPTGPAPRLLSTAEANPIQESKIPNVARETEQNPNIGPTTFEPRNAGTAADRARFGLSELPKAERVMLEETFEKGKALDVSEVKAKAQTKGVLLNDAEVGALARQGAEQKARLNALYGDPNADPAQIQAATAAFDETTRILKEAGTEAGRAFNARKMAVTLLDKDDFSVAAVLGRAKAKKGNALAPEIEKDLVAKAKALEEAEQRVRELEGGLIPKLPKDSPEAIALEKRALEMDTWDDRLDPERLDVFDERFARALHRHAFGADLPPNRSEWQEALESARETIRRQADELNDPMEVSRLERRAGAYEANRHLSDVRGTRDFERVRKDRRGNWIRDARNASKFTNLDGIDPEYHAEIVDYARRQLDNEVSYVSEGAWRHYTNTGTMRSRKGAEIIFDEVSEADFAAGSYNPKDINIPAAAVREFVKDLRESAATVAKRAKTGRTVTGDRELRSAVDRLNRPGDAPIIREKIVTVQDPQLLGEAAMLRRAKFDLEKEIAKLRAAEIRQSRTVRRGSRQSRRAELDSEFADLKAQLTAPTKGGGGMRSRQGGAIDLGPLAERTGTIYRMAANRARATGLKAEEIVDEIVTTLKVAGIEATPTHVRNAIAQGRMDATAGAKTVRAMRGTVRARRALASGDLESGLPTLRGKAREPLELRVAKNQRDKLRGEIRRRIADQEGRTTLDRVAEIAGVPRSIMATLDNSMLGRQGLLMGLDDPKGWAKAALNSGKALKEANFIEMERAMRKRPRFAEAELYGLHFDDPLSLGTGGRAEDFATPLTAKIPGIKQVTAGGERVGAAVQNTLRMRAWERAREQFPDATDEQLKDLAGMLNAASGRGYIGRDPNIAKALGAAFFSPRYLMSRWQVLTKALSLRKAVKGDPAARIALRQTTKLAGVYAGIAYLAVQNGGKVSFDPESPDFLKIRFGLLTIDPGTGFVQIVRLLARTGQLLATNNKGKGFGAGDVFEPGFKYVQYKASPAFTGLPAIIGGEDAVGQEQNRFVAAGKLGLPLTPTQGIEAANEKGGSPALPWLVAGLNFWGVGADAYPAKTKAKAAKKKKLPEPLPKAIKNDADEVIRYFQNLGRR